MLFADETRKKPMAVLHGLRQQAPKREGRANLSLGDFVAPAETALEERESQLATVSAKAEAQLAQLREKANGAEAETGRLRKELARSGDLAARETELKRMASSRMSKRPNVTSS